jgi:YD repeat-containing protein
MQPDISLVYNSRNTDQDSIVGYGWSLSIPYIERLNKTGSQDMYGPNAYFSSSLDGELAIASGTVATSSLNILVIAGGGGGGAGDGGGGGGGAGGVVASTSYMVTPGTYTVIVGAGGTGVTHSNGTDGNNSVFATITALKGGGGGYSDGTPSGNGGSGTYGSGGGGSGWDAMGPGLGGAGTAGQGNSGGNGAPSSNNYGAGGGGGASASASNAASSNGTSGGNGVSSSISGSAVTYGGGGGGGSGSPGSPGAGGSGGGGDGGAVGGNVGHNGTANTGGGGGGGSDANVAGGNGGSGIVIVSYPTASTSDYTCGGSTTTTGTSTVCTYTSNGTFTVGQIATTTSPTYTARIDDGSFRSYKYSTSTNSWTMYDKKGTQYLFGTTTQSQQSATTSPSNVYKWMLERITDTNGNYIRYVYNKDGNQIYPYKIIYSGNGSTDGPMTITFATSTRSDKVMSFKGGFEEDTNYRISQITASVNANTVRQYSLSYTTANNGIRSLLSSIQENGYDDNNVLTSLPAMTFGYVSSSTSFATTTGSGVVNGDPYLPADVDGNGQNDSTNIECASVTGPENGYIYLDGTTSTTFTPTQVNQLCWSSGTTGRGALNETGTRFLDINADGKADIVQGSYATSTGVTANGLYVNAYATSTKWTTTTSWNGIVPTFVLLPTSETTGFFGDVNGDGLPDYEIALATSTGQSSLNGAYLGNGSTWNPATTTVFTPVKNVPTTSSDCTASQLFDVNGDGLADWVFTDGTSTYVQLNTGKGWASAPDSRWTLSTSTVFNSGGTCYDRGMRFVDVNGDGLPDFVRSYTVSASAGLPEVGTYQFVYLNTGAGWATSTAYTLPYVISNTSGTSTITYAQLANFIGNGQQNQDVLSVITYPKGGSTNATYSYTTQSGVNKQLPYNLLVVTKLVNNPGLGTNEENDYSYAGGLQYLPSNVYDRKFAGFASTTNSNSDGKIVTYYSQGTAVPSLGDQVDGYGQLNHPFRTDVLTPSGTLVQKTFFQWNAIVHGRGQFVGLTRQLEQDYAGNGTHQDKDTEYVYSTTTDDLIQIKNYGAVTGNDDGTFTDITGDSRTTNITYAASSSLNISLPIEKSVLNNGGATSTDSLLYYDSLPFGQINVGNQTQQKDWITGATYASSTMTYNSFGLVATSTDRNGNATAYMYDALNLYPATTTNALSQSTKYTYEYSNGKTEKTTSANGGVANNVYDGIGRLIEVDQSSLTTPSTLATSTVYQFTDNSIPPSIIHETDYLNGATSTYTYDIYDGLDRLIQEEKSTENSGTSTVTSLGYSTAGKLASQSLPFFILGTPTTSPFAPGNTSVLVVAGGGGGGAGDGGGGGGGAGGVVASTSYTVIPGTYTVTVGAGGTGAASSNGTDGNNSVFATVTALKGGGGGYSNGTPSGSGGSGSYGSGGGGSAWDAGGPGLGGAGTAGQGNAGGNGAPSSHNYGAGGGGGAGASGSSASASNNGVNGGNGATSSISGSVVTYGGGGGGGGGSPGSSGSGGTGGGGNAGAVGGNVGQNGTANTGGGGGGGSDANVAGGNGGSGIVIVSYPTASAPDYTCGGSTTTTGISTVCTYTSNGTFIVGTSFVPVIPTATLLTSYTYDPLGRTITTANAVGTTTNAYSAWTTTVVDPLGHIKDSIVDAYSNLSQVVEHGATSNATTTYTYDAANNLTNITDALSNVRNFTYDGLGNRLTAQDLHANSDATFGTWLYSYDSAGNLASSTDPKGQNVTHTYDALNRPLTESWVGHGTQITNTYDSCTNGIGLLCSASSTAALDANAYDVLGHTVGATTTISGTSYGLVYGYDRQGNITGVTNNSNNAKLAYTYNSAGLISALNRTTASTSSLIASMFNYSPIGQVGQVVFASGASTTYSYDPTALYRLTRILTLGAASSTSVISSGSKTVKILLVAGGGGGGTGSGGGGAGGVIENLSYTLAAGTYSVVVGTHGTGNISGGASATNGHDTTFNGNTAVGGGQADPGTSGGSGGGGTWNGSGGAGTAGQGNAGGNGFNGDPFEGAGGGGAGAAGGNGTSAHVGGAGGNGVTSSVGPASTVYGGGGGGGTDNTHSDSTGGAGGTGGGGHGGDANGTNANMTSGTNGLGGGGGGSTNNFNAANGGDGVFIIRYTTTDFGTVTGASSTVIDGSETYQVFNSNGTLTMTSANSTTTSTKLQDLNYTYDADGNILTRTDNSISGSGQKVTYTYDSLNRLTSASTTLSNSNSYSQTFAYDALGNITSGPLGTYSYQGNTGSSYANPDAVTQVLLRTGQTAPSIAYDNSGLGGNGTPASSLTFSYTTNSNTNGLIIVSVEEATTSPSCTSDKVTGVTNNGTSLTDLGYYAKDSQGLALKTYYGFAPATSTHNIVVSASASCIRYAVAATYTGVKQSGMPDASGSGNPLNSSGLVSLLQATTSTNYNAWAVLIGAPSTAGTATAGAGTTIRQQQSGEIYYADSNGPVFGPTGLSWSKSAGDWAANYFSIPAFTSNPGTTATTSLSYDNNGNVLSVRYYHLLHLRLPESPYTIRCLEWQRHDNDHLRLRSLRRACVADDRQLDDGVSE